MALEASSSKESLIRNRSFPLEYSVNHKMPYFDFKIDPTIEDDTLNQRKVESSDIKNAKIVKTNEIMANNGCLNSVTKDHSAVVS